MAALPPGREPQYKFNRRLDGPQSRSGCGGEEMKITAPAGNKIPVMQTVPQSLHTFLFVYKYSYTTFLNILRTTRLGFNLCLSTYYLIAQSV
jgi:hypothetical protein